MRIGQLAETTGFTTKTVRYYEALGLLQRPRRTGSGYREYQAGDVDRLLFIRKAQHLGLSLTEIKDILALYDRREPTCVHVRSLLDAKLAQVDATLRDLQTLRKEMLRLRAEAGSVVDCRAQGGAICSFIEHASGSTNQAVPVLFRRRGRQGSALPETTQGRRSTRR